MTRPFTIDLGWTGLLSGVGLRSADVLRLADLPEDMFTRERPSLPAERFFRLFQVLADALQTDAPGLALGLAVQPEVFSPPLFAAFCSPDLVSAATRLSQYKPLVGPIRLDVHDMTGGLELTLAGTDGIVFPPEYVAAELVFLVQLARLATRSEIRPIAVEMVSPPSSPAYPRFFGHRLREGPFDRVVFSRADARRPFLSANPALFRVFDDDLRARLDEQEAGASVAVRLHAALMEAMPAGQAGIDTVARRLGMSARTLQRRLGAEGTSFQAELRSLRERLARSYLTGTAYSIAEIAFLLGYEDPNSFFRAFHDWTGATPEAVRRAA